MSDSLGLLQTALSSHVGAGNQAPVFSLAQSYLIFVHARDLSPWEVEMRQEDQFKASLDLHQV